MKNNNPTRRAALALGTGAAAAAIVNPVSAQSADPISSAVSTTRVEGAQESAKPLTEVRTPRGAHRERTCIDKDWRFSLGDAVHAEKDYGYGLRPFFFAKAGYGDGPADPKFDAVAWRRVDLPHDWAVELPFDQRGDTNHGSKAIGRNFPENSVGWYRRIIDIPATDEGRRISIEFDGVYRNSVFWVNGHYIGTEPSGYSSFSYDITDYITFGGANVVVVRADASVEEGWFYEGAGIYRHVWLTKTEPLHVGQWGTFVKSHLGADGAKLEIDVTIVNDAKSDDLFSIRHEVFDEDEKLVARDQAGGLSVKAVSSADFSTRMDVSEPRVWSVENPHLYSLRTTILRAEQPVDVYETRFGVRTVIWDPEKGFFLNGKNIKLQGTCNHQDHAGLGVALPDDLQAWRLKQLKSFGVNAYRASHNPPTPELLDAADRLGMLVIDEHRMMGTTPEIRSQLERLIRRDRNHPSVIVWSVGNEEWALEWAPLGTRLVNEMQDIVRRLDPTRRTTVATSGSGAGVSLGADVIGFNYGAQHDVDAFHKAHPHKPAMMTEEGSTLTTRGIYLDDRVNSHLNAYDRQGRPGNSLSIEEGWRRVEDRPWMAGMFVWTGFDYRGETTPFGWPAVSSQFGMIDATGVLKDSAYYLKSAWTSEPMVHILPHWNWNGREGQPIDVRVYSNGDTVELFLDDWSLGRQAMVKNSHLKWTVPYRAGRLSAKSYRGGKQIATTEVVTTTQAAVVTLAADKQTLRANGTDTSVVWVNVKDATGRIVPTASDLVTFYSEGPIRILGVGNGDPASHEADKYVERHVSYGAKNWRALPIDSLEANSVTGENVNTGTWLDPRQWIPPEARPAKTKGLVLRGEFTAPSVAPGARVAIFIAQLDSKQKVYINGALVKPVSSDGGLVVTLDTGQMKDITTLTYIVPSPDDGIQGLFDRSVGGSKWGLMRVTTPADSWSRSVFNGWAQIIVQSTEEAGTARLKASAIGLKGAVVSFETGGT